LVREDVDPDLAPTLDVAGHRNTRGLDLAVRDVRRFQGLDPVLAEHHPRTALGDAAALRVVRLAEPLRGLTRHQPLAALLLRFRGSRRSGDRGRVLGLAGRALALRRGSRRGSRGGATRPGSRTSTPSALTARTRRRLDRGLAARHGVTLVNPDLHADTAERGTGLEEPVLDVGPQRVQRNPAFPVELRAAHLRAAQAAGDLNPNALDNRVLHRRLDRLAHGPAEADPTGQLLGHALRDELRVRLGVLHLENVELHLLAGELLQLDPHSVRLRALTSDHD